MKRLVSVVLPLVVLAAGWFAYTTLPQQRDILHALRMAEKVTVTEYRRGPLQGGYEDVMTEKVLSEPERSELLRAFSPHGLRSKPEGPFDPHHRIECVMQDGTPLVIHLCFACNEYSLDQGPHHSLGPWSETLRETLPRLGIPIRPSKQVKGQ